MLLLAKRVRNSEKQNVARNVISRKNLEIRWIITLSSFIQQVTQTGVVLLTREHTFHLQI